jgi:hypothetical protein
VTIHGTIGNKAGLVVHAFDAPRTAPDHVFSYCQGRAVRRDRVTFTDAPVTCQLCLKKGA